jgi:hypothetical protein
LGLLGVTSAACTPLTLSPSQTTAPSRASILLTETSLVLELFNH